MSQCYPSARQKALTTGMNWTGGTLRAVLLGPAYVPNFEDIYLSDIFSGVRIAISDPLENRTAINGYAMSDPIRFPALLDNRLAAQAIIFRDTTVAETSELIFYMSPDQLTGVPFALEGLDYFIYPNALEGGFFRL